MFKIIEIIIISAAGAGAIFFFVWYMIKEVKGKNKCAGCAAFDYCEEYKKKANKINDCKERVN